MSIRALFFGLLTVLTFHGGMVSCNSKQIASLSSDSSSTSSPTSTPTPDSQTSMKKVRASDLKSEINGLVNEFAPDIPSELLQIFDESKTAYQNAIDILTQRRQTVNKMIEAIGGFKQDGKWRFDGSRANKEMMQQLGLGHLTETDRQNLWDDLTNESNELTTGLNKIRKNKFSKDLQELREGIQNLKDRDKDLEKQLDDIERDLADTKKEMDILKRKVEGRKSTLGAKDIKYLDNINKAYNDLGVAEYRLPARPVVGTPLADGTGVYFRQTGSINIGGSSTAKSNFTLQFNGAYGKFDVSAGGGYEISLPKTNSPTNIRLKVYPEEGMATITDDNGSETRNMQKQQGKSFPNSGIKIDGNPDSKIFSIAVTPF